MTTYVHLAHCSGLLWSLSSLVRVFLRIECQQHWLGCLMENGSSRIVLLIDQQSETSWPVFLHHYRKHLINRLFLDFDRCQSSRCLRGLEFRPILSACFREQLNQSIDSVELCASTESSMVMPTDFCRMSSVRTWPIVSSKFRFKQLLENVVQNTSEFARSLENRARAFTYSSKLIPWDESLDNTWLKVLMWEVAGLVSLIFMLSFEDEDFFSYTAYSFFHKENVVVSFAILKY